MTALLEPLGAGEGGRTAAWCSSSGEPGIGKSRLALELAGHVRRRQATVLRFQCSPHHQSSMLHPVLERLQRAAAPPARETGPPPAPHASGRCWAAAARRPRPRWRLLAELMALPAAARAETPQADAQRRRELLFEALIADLQRLAPDRPCCSCWRTRIGSIPPRSSSST